MASRVLVVGAGFTGAVIAERVASESGHTVVVVDRRDHIAGNAYDHRDAFGVQVHRYGPHIFHTNSADVFDYLSQFTAWRPYEHRVKAMVDDRFVPLPINLTSLELLFGAREAGELAALLQQEFGAETNVPILRMRQSRSPEVRKLSDFLYEKVFLNYSLKHWGRSPEELDPSVSARVPIRLSRDERYFLDRYQGMPTPGYTELVGRILDHPRIEVRLATSYLSAIGDGRFDLVVFTGPIDEYFDRRHGALPYRNIQFDLRSERSVDPVQPAGTLNFPTPAGDHAYTRVTEYRILTGQDDVETTTRSYEFPQPYIRGENEPCYPIPQADNRALFRRYRDDARKLKTVVFAGRLGDYAYYNMDQAVARGLACFEKEIAAKL